MTLAGAQSKLFADAEQSSSPSSISALSRNHSAPDPNIKCGTKRAENNANVTPIANVKANARAADASPLNSNSNSRAEQEEQLPANPLSSFSSLPPELRNQIYKLVLVSGHRITLFRPHSLVQPALTKTCRQIRRESLGIYYSRNSFYGRIIDYDPTMYIKWRKVASPLCSRMKVTLHCIDPAPERRPIARSNLMDWIERLYLNWEGYGRSLPCYTEGIVFDVEKFRHRKVKVWMIVYALRDGGVPWKVAKGVIEHAIDAAGLFGNH